MLADAAETVTVPEAVSVPEKVLLPVKVWVPARIASYEEVFGSVKVRVVPVVMPDSENSAFLVGSASLTRLKIASETSCGTPTGSHAVPFQTTNACSTAIQTSQPWRVTRRSQEPST